jgi:hypothetical protein
MTAITVASLAMSASSLQMSNVTAPSTTDEWEMARRRESLPPDRKLIDVLS